MIYQKQNKKLKSHDRKYLLSSKFLDKCKKEYKKVMENVRSATESYWMNTTIVSFDPFTSDLLCVKFHGEDGWFNHFKYFENDKNYVNEFLHC